MLINVSFDTQIDEMYPDLKNAFGYNKTALYNHWIQYGRSEGRKSSILFDLKVYVDHNGDLKSVYGNNYGGAFDHFLNFGCNEYRKMSLVFDPVSFTTHYTKNGVKALNAIARTGKWYYSYRYALIYGTQSS